MEPVHPEVAPVFAGAFVLVILFIALLILAFTVWLFCRIFSKAGFHWALGFLTLIPSVGVLVALLILAFGQWPVHQELKSLKQPPSDQPPAQFV